MLERGGARDKALELLQKSRTCLDEFRSLVVVAYRRRHVMARQAQHETEADCTAMTRSTSTGLVSQEAIAVDPDDMQCYHVVMSNLAQV